MLPLSSSLFHRKISLIVFVAILMISRWSSVAAQEAPHAKAEAPAASTEAQPKEAEESGRSATTYDQTLFRDLVPSGQLAFLNHFSALPSGKIVRDTQYRKLMSSVIPHWVFHYGWDMSLSDGMNKVLEGSKLPVQIRDGRYVVVSGRNGPYLQGRGLMWIDMRDGLALGAFYFHPTNGEPTPTVTVFSSQVKEDSLGLSQLPPAFAQELRRWSADSGIAPITTRYFIGGVNKKVLLEHDEDYCLPVSIPGCAEMNADAADTDLNAAYYLEQTNYATNATAWMILGPEQVAWIQTRNNACGNGPDWLPCRIRMTRQRIGGMVRGHVVAQSPHR